MQGKVLPERSAAIRVYVGIDVCKGWLDVYLHPSGHSLRVANDAAGLKRLKRELARYDIAGVVLEATGKHHRLAQRHLHAAGIPVAVVNPLRARLFAEAKGALAKTDATDARLLAMMAEAFAPRTTPPLPQTVEDLQEIVRARAAAVEDRTALLNQRGEARVRLLKVELGRRIAALSIPGIGPIAALGLMAGLAEELGARSSKQIAMLSGLAPVARDSGDRTGPRHIRGGRGQVRTAVYFAALSAARYNASLRCVYQRLIAAGKRPKVALVAIMRKLVILANTLVREDRLWQPNPA